MSQLEQELDELLNDDGSFEQLKAEVDAVANMLAQANAAGLTAEVVMSFGAARASGSSTIDAAQEALFEWDC